MWGFFIGAAAGAAQLFLLEKFARGVTSGKPGGRAVAFGIVQLFLPFAVLLLVAFLLRDLLLWVGIGMAAALVAGGFVRFFMIRRSGRRDE